MLFSLLFWLSTPPCKVKKDHQPQRGFTVEFTYSLPMGEFRIRTPKSQLVRAEGPAICVNPRQQMFFSLWEKVSQHSNA